MSDYLTDLADLLTESALEAYVSNKTRERLAEAAGALRRVRQGPDREGEHRCAMI